MKKKLLSWLLAICMILPCVFTLNACGGKDEDVKITEEIWNSEINDTDYSNRVFNFNYTVSIKTPENTDIKRFYFTTMPRKELNGKEYAPYFSNGAYYDIQPYPADENGDIILNEKGEAWWRREDFQDKFVTVEDLVKHPYSEQTSGYNYLIMRTVEPEERLAISDLSNFFDSIKNKFNLFTVNKTVATLTGNKPEFAGLGEHVKTLYNLDGNVEWTDIQLEFVKKDYQATIPIALDEMTFNANVVNSQTVNSIEIKFENLYGGLSDNDVGIEQLFCYILKPTNFTITGVNNAQEEIYQFTENGLRAYRPDNTDESLREVLVYHDTTADTYTEYKKNTDGTWTATPFTKEQYDLFISTTKQLIFGNFIDALAQNIELLSYSKYEEEYNSEYRFLTVNNDITFNYGSFSFNNVKFTGVNRNSSNFGELKAVDYTLTYTVGNVVADVLNYHVEIGNASFTLPTV
ncbi:MAG: hypothetical protein IJB34_03475 [Clostridia bacterium]|nr:hypothetical protein [Clostridia bacterium]